MTLSWCADLHGIASLLFLPISHCLGNVSFLFSPGLIVSGRPFFHGIICVCWVCLENELCWASSTTKVEAQKLYAKIVLPFHILQGKLLKQKRFYQEPEPQQRVHLTIIPEARRFFHRYVHNLQGKELQQEKQEKKWQHGLSLQSASLKTHLQHKLCFRQISSLPAFCSWILSPCTWSFHKCCISHSWEASCALSWSYDLVASP